MTSQNIELRVARDFTVNPGPRKKEDGQFSGEEFLTLELEPKFREAYNAKSILTVNLDGVSGYPTSFLEEAFGGLARSFGSRVVNRHLEIISEDEPYLKEEIQQYIDQVQNP